MDLVRFHPPGVRRLQLSLLHPIASAATKRLASLMAVDHTLGFRLGVPGLACPSWDPAWHFHAAGIHFAALEHRGYVRPGQASPSISWPTPSVTSSGRAFWQGRRRMVKPETIPQRSTT